MVVVVAVVLVVQQVFTVEAKEPTAYFQLPLQQVVAAARASVRTGVAEIVGAAGENRGVGPSSVGLRQKGRHAGPRVTQI